LKQTPLKSQDDLDKMMDVILGQEGEGVMLKDPASMYEQKRSHLLLKVKKFD